MNYSNEVNNISKYNYTRTESDQQLYIFELILKTITDEDKIFRCIKKNTQGSIINSEDNILFETITKFKLTVLNINNLNNQIIIKKLIDHSINSNTFLTNEIYLELNKTENNLIELNYNIII